MILGAPIDILDTHRSPGGALNPSSKLVLVLALLAAGATPALAAWPNSPFINLPVCTAANGQNSPAIVSDGAGGAIVSWSDNRSGTSWDVYAQHVLSTGAVDPAWPANGSVLSAAGNAQVTYPTIVSDGAGGAIVTWQDLRSGTSYDIYAQHVLASGLVDPAWPVNGTALCTAPYNQSSPTIVADGAGGAIVSWQDLRGGGAITHVYAQHVLAAGNVDPAWPVDGTAVCLAAYGQFSPMLAPDGAGGAIATWYDIRSGTNHIYAQHVLAAGNVDPAWPVDGRILCAAAGGQSNHTLVADGSGGAIVTWQDLRNGASTDIYAQHVLASGVVDPTWPGDGRALCVAVNSQSSPTIAPDGTGGAIVAWQDFRSSASLDIYAQHVLASGSVDPAWPIDGRAVCVAANNQYTPCIAADGAGGAIVAWQDLRSSSNYDVYAQHVLASGAVDPTWPTDGRALSTATNNQLSQAIVADGTGGAIAAWQDYRSGTSHIYAQRVARYGYLGTPEAEIVGVTDVPNDEGGKVKVSWNASWLDLAQDINFSAYDLLRSVPAAVAAARLARGERLATSFAGLAGAGGMIAIPGAAQGYYWEYLSTVTGLHYLSGYSALAPTTGDSMPARNPLTAFMVVAHNTSGSMFWPSRPDSGYSVDNLSPGIPAPFAANYAAGTTHLHWNPNTEPGLAGYRLYRGTSPAFAPSPATLVAAQPDTGYADASAATFTYKLSAVDVHGNESGFATLTPSAITGVGAGTLPRELALAPASPNPATRGTTLRFSLPLGASIRLGVYDTAGRLVRTLASGTTAAGEHAATWDLRDGSGRLVGAGLYFAGLEAGGRTLVRRIAVAP